MKKDLHAFEIGLEFYLLQKKLKHPAGWFDDGGRWYPTIETSSLDKIRKPSRNHPISYQSHCRTAKYLSVAHKVDIVVVKKVKAIINEVSELNNLETKEDIEKYFKTEISINSDKLLEKIKCLDCNEAKNYNNYYYIDGGLGFTDEKFNVCSDCISKFNSSRNRHKYFDEQITATYFGAKCVTEGNNISEIASKITNGITVDSNKMAIQNFLYLFGKEKGLSSYSQQMKKIFDSYNEKQSYESLQQDFTKEIEQSANVSASVRGKRLKKALKTAKITEATIKVYVRNPDVVAEVLYRAKGICEKCHKPAPFIRAKDNTPFLEVHHIQGIAQGGLDIVENALALCPNCHRELHYGISEVSVNLLP